MGVGFRESTAGGGLHAGQPAVSSAWRGAEVEVGRRRRQLANCITRREPWSAVLLGKVDDEKGKKCKNGEHW